MLYDGSTKTVMFDSKTISSLGLKTSYVLPTELKEIVSLTLFKKKKKKIVIES